MRVNNKTNYNTEHIRRLFILCMQRVRADWQPDWANTKGLIVTVSYARRKHFISGNASLPRAGRTPRMTVRIPSEWIPKDFAKEYAGTKWESRHVGYKNGDLVQALASTFIHELGHTLGIHYHTDGRTIEHRYEDWIYANTSYSLFQILEPESVKPKIDIRVKRYERAMVNLQRAGTRLRRAKTLFQKWTAKVRYYERILPQAAKHPERRKGKC